MKKYSVEVSLFGGYVFEIEAENEEQAIDIAGDKEIDIASVQHWDTDLWITEEN